MMQAVRAPGANAQTAALSTEPAPQQILIRPRRGVDLPDARELWEHRELLFMWPLENMFARNNAFIHPVRVNDGHTSDIVHDELVQDLTTRTRYRRADHFFDHYVIYFHSKPTN